MWLHTLCFYFSLESIRVRHMLFVQITENVPRKGCKNCSRLTSQPHIINLWVVAIYEKELTFPSCTSVWIAGFGFNHEGALLYARINPRYAKRKERLFKYDANTCGKSHCIFKLTNINPDVLHSPHEVVGELGRGHNYWNVFQAVFE